jgi:hypothetical protein
VGKIIYKIDNKIYKYGFKLNKKIIKNQSIYHPVISSETKNLSFDIITNTDNKAIKDSPGKLECEFISAENSLGDLEDMTRHIKGGAGRTTTTTTYEVLNKSLPPGEYIISCETDINISEGTETEKEKHIAKVLKLNVFRIKECEKIPKSMTNEKNEYIKGSKAPNLDGFCGGDKINCNNNQHGKIKKFQKGLQSFYRKWALTPKGRYFLYDLSMIKEEKFSISEIFKGCNKIDGVYGKCTEGALRAWCQYSPKKS